jgi:RNA polymerase sigma-70 factor, ECF subfamily
MVKNQTTDPASWVHQHGDYLYRYALLRLGDPEIAADLVQDAFLSGLRSRLSFSGRSSERTWLVGILKHKIIDRQRRFGQLPEVLDGQAAEQAIDGLFDHRRHWKTAPEHWAGEPSRWLESRELWDVLASCLSGLPRRLAEAFALRELDELEIAEICDDLGISPNNLSARLYRARLLLRDCLERRWFRGDRSAG